MKELSIIIPVFNNCQFTKACLSDLSKLEIDKEIIIVDNNSSDDTFNIVSQFEDVIYLKNNINEGFSKANNKGYKESCGEYVLFLNNDIKVLDRIKDWPQLLIDSCDNGVVGTQSGLIDSKYKFVKEGKFDPNIKGGYLSGWCVLAKRSTWDSLVLDEQIGPWNSLYYLYYEDNDLSFRVKKAKLPLKIIDVPVHHYSRVTGKKFNMFHHLNKSKRIFKKIWKNIV